MDQGWLQFLAYGATLVWGAATVKAELRYLRSDLQDFKTAVAEASKVMTETVSDHGERISRIEGRLG